MPSRIAPSILSADFANLEREIRLMEEAGAELIHVDVMDGHFVPNLTIGIPVVASLRKITRLVLDVHLMISNPDQLVDGFIEAGADQITVHFETVTHLDRLIEHIREKGVLPGVALNPHTPVGVLEDILPKCGLVLIMSVNPGFGGQKFISHSLEKVRKLKRLILERGLDTLIEIDGGIDPGNTEPAVIAGVDLIVAGSAIFGQERPGEVFRTMQSLAGNAAAYKI